MQAPKLHSDKTICKFPEVMGQLIPPNPRRDFHVHRWTCFAPRSRRNLIHVRGQGSRLSYIWTNWKLIDCQMQILHEELEIVWSLWLTKKDMVIKFGKGTNLNVVVDLWEKLPNTLTPAHWRMLMWKLQSWWKEARQDDPHKNTLRVPIYCAGQWTSIVH